MPRDYCGGCDNVSTSLIKWFTDFSSSFLSAICYIGACEVDKSYEGPKLPQQDGKYHMTQEFIQEMIELFKAGKFLPKRYAWEIVMGAHEHFAQEESLVDVEIPEDVTIDVIGDVHGASSFFCLLSS